MEEKQKREQVAVGADLTILYGSATLTTTAGGNYREVYRSQWGILGVPIGAGNVWAVQQQQGHAVTFGATRSGKGVQSIIPALLTYNGSMVVIDPKGENAWATAERRRQMGQRVVILDPWGEVNRRYGSKATPPVTEQTTRYNPLSAIDPRSEDFNDDVSAIADALIIAGEGGDSHWTDSARELISGLVAARIEVAPGKAHLGEVRQALTGDDDTLVKMVTGILAANPDSLAAGKLKRFAQADTGTEIKSIRSTAVTQTAILDSRRLVASMETGEPPFNLEELATGRVTLYLVLPLDRLKTHGRWMRLVLTMAIRAIAKQDEPPQVPVMFLLDEMGTIGSLTMVEQAFGLMAGIGVRIWAFLQDLPQLQRDYPASWETFISNSSLIQALKVTDLTTSRYLSELIGTTTLERYSAESLHVREKNPEFKGMADQVHGRALLLPQEIRTLSPNQVLSIMPGLGNFLLPREPYYGHGSPWAGLYRSPPRFAAANAAPPPPPPAPPPPEPPKKKGFFS
jgi:type IV secretion system protein VirD4